jgi:hypothetical protein
VRFREASGPSQVDRIARRRQISIGANMEPGFDQKSALDALDAEAAAKGMTPDDYRTTWIVADDPAALASVIVHELGHGLGLFHTQENDRFGAAIFDVIADTPNDNAANNVMFFDLSRATSASFSNGQGSTMRQAPQVQP